MIYNGCHMYLAQRVVVGGFGPWREAIDKVEALKPQHIVCGHQNKHLDDHAERTIAKTRQYLDRADELLRTRSTPVDFFNAMIERYPNHLVRTVLWVAPGRSTWRANTQKRTSVIPSSPLGLSRNGYPFNAYHAREFAYFVAPFCTPYSEHFAMKSGTSTREKLKDPPQTHEVGSLKQAVALAQRFKDKGKYDWFRGQVAPWVPHSSLFRRFIMEDKSEHDHAIWRWDRLIAWARQIPELSRTLNSKNLYELLAIAQHHGILTNLIDFTTDPAVAGFFSADTDKPHIARLRHLLFRLLRATGCTRSTPRKGTSCIYCLNTKRLEKVWAHTSATRSVQGAHIETIRINVENLWRLQSQRGVFLHANYYWEADYPMDRILVPIHWISGRSSSVADLSGRQEPTRTAARPVLRARDCGSLRATRGRGHQARAGAGAQVDYHVDHHEFERIGAIRLQRGNAGRAASVLGPQNAR